MAKTSDDTSSSEPAEPTNESQPDASTDPSPPAEKSAE